MYYQLERLFFHFGTVPEDKFPNFSFEKTERTHVFDLFESANSFFF
jgi:hypothetical protein